MARAAKPKKEISMEEALWKSADKLRGSVEPAEYKHVVLSLFFLKFASDKFEECRNKIISTHGEKYADMKPFYTQENVFYLPEESRWKYIIENAKQDDIALKIDTALYTIEKNNPALKGALPDNYYSRLHIDTAKLASLLDEINRINTDDKENDIIGRVYEYFLSKFALAEGKGKGEFYTPKCIVNLIAEMLEPYDGILYDPYKAITERIALKQKINDNLVAVGTASIQKNVGRGALINLTEPEMDRLTLPDDFEIQTVSEFCRETKSGSTPSRTNNEYWENGTISWVKSGEVHNNITLQTEEYITPLGLSESSTKLLPKDTVLMAMYGVTAGEVGYLAIEATTNQAICGMICNSKADAAYLYFSLIQSQAAISRLSNGGAQDNLSKNFIDNIKIVVPSSEFIEELNLAAIVEQMTLNTKEIALLEELQATALAQLSSH